VKGKVKKVDKVCHENYFLLLSTFNLCSFLSLSSVFHYLNSQSLQPANLKRTSQIALSRFKFKTMKSKLGVRRKILRSSYLLNYKYLLYPFSFALFLILIHLIWTKNLLIERGYKVLFGIKHQFAINFVFKHAKRHENRIWKKLSFFHL
jgi:hypothetical protein